MCIPSSAQEAEAHMSSQGLFRWLASHRLALYIVRFQLFRYIDTIIAPEFLLIGHAASPELSCSSFEEERGKKTNGELVMLQDCL
jgi:hypothetical protein